MITLKSDRLQVEIANPGEGRNTTVRFDRAGFITRVCLDGKHEFCTVEPDNLSHPCSGGAGLCSEIKDGDIWSETAIGEDCPKFGVGLLTKPTEEKYKFFAKYDTKPFDIKITAGESEAVFETAPVSCMGYALRQKKTVTVSGNTVTVKYEYENVGEKSLALSEYCHNFVTIDKLPIGPEYTISMPTIASQDNKAPKQETATIYGKGSGFTYSAYNPAAGMIDVSGDEIDPSKPFSWTIKNSTTSAYLSEEDSFTPSKIAIWTIDHIISPEVFTSFEIAPGETHTYERKWTFNG
jgi:hypothetical protein